MQKVKVIIKSSFKPGLKPDASARTKVNLAPLALASPQQVSNINDKSVTSWQLPRLRGSYRRNAFNGFWALNKISFLFAKNTAQIFIIDCRECIQIDSVVFLRHCALYKTINLLTYLFRCSIQRVWRCEYRIETAA